jgi:hypothetical protein
LSGHSRGLNPTAWRRVSGLSVLRLSKFHEAHGAKPRPDIRHRTYLVLDEIAHSRVYRETEEIDADRAAVVLDIAAEQYNRPYRVVAFNTGEGWARDVTEEITREMIDTAVRSGRPLTHSARGFIERVTDEDIPQSAIEGR